MPKRITYRELCKVFCEHERKEDGTHLLGAIVFRSDNWPNQDYTLEARTYNVSSNNKAFQPNMGGYSIYGSAADGSDPMVRLERYMFDEHGGEKGWKVDYCYIR